jgi:hypothetical protein
LHTDLLLNRDAMGDATARFEYLRNLDVYHQEKPYYYDGPLSPDLEPKRTNLQYESIPVPVQDGRTNSQRFTLQENGFKLMKHETCTALNEEPRPSQATVDAYLSEVVDILRKEFDGSKVIVFDYAVSRLYSNITMKEP